MWLLTTHRYINIHMYMYVYNIDNQNYLYYMQIISDEDNDEDTVLQTLKNNTLEIWKDLNNSAV